MAKNTITGRAKKYDGTAIDYVSIFKWTGGECIAQIIPDASGNWSYRYFETMEVGISYIADGCEPVTHGSYYFKYLNIDEYADNVVALLHFNDSLTDQTGRLWTANNSPAFVAGRFNNALRLSGNAIYTPYNSDFDWDTDDFTIECFVKASTWASFSDPAPANGIPRLIGRMGRSSGTNQWSFGPVTTGKLHFYYYSDGQKLLIASNGTLPVNAWVHIAFCKDATNAYVAIDGVVTSAALPASITLPEVSEAITIGRYNNNSVDGFIDELRITKGVARYTENFTPPIEPFPI